MDKITPIKENILHLLEIENISKEDFYKTTGISASNFKGKGLNSELGGDKIAKILTCYANWSAEWLILKQGNKFKNIESLQKNAVNESPEVYLKSDNEFIVQLKKSIEIKDELIALYKNKFELREPNTIVDDFEKRLQSLESFNKTLQLKLKLDLEVESIEESIKAEKLKKSIASKSH